MSLNAQPSMRADDGQRLMPVLGVGTFSTHTAVHSHQCIPMPTTPDDRRVPPEQMSL